MAPSVEIESDGHARVRMVARPASVPAVRRFVGQALGAWGLDELADDLTLAASELATNATLHSGGPYFEVELRRDGAGVRMEVRDRGATPARAIADRGRAAASPEAMKHSSTGGRGLFIVAALATAWGIDDVGSGTRIWARFAPGGDDAAGAPTLSGDEPLTEDHPVRIIELLGCPAELLLDHDANLADIARELRLFGSSRRDTAAVDRAERIGAVVRASAASWDAARLLAQQAVLDGRATVDVAIVPQDIGDVARKLRVLREAVGAAEAMMAEGLLIALPAPPPVQEWRDWVETEMVAQAAGVRAPVPFADWCGHRAPSSNAPADEG